MAVTTVYTYDLNGSKKDFDVPFEYLARRFVQVTLIGQDRKPLDLASDFRFIGKTSIQTLKAWGPADGYERIEIRRNTSATDRLVDFADGSILRANELNTSQVQTLHVAEEARNMVVDTIGADNNGNLDARGRRIVNTADGVEPGDAVTLRQQRAWGESALNQANRAQSEANKAQSEADRATARANESASNASAVSGWTAETKAARDAAKASEVASKASETKAKTSEINSKTSETNAASNAANATQQADRALAQADRAKYEADKLGSTNSFAANLDATNTTTSQVALKPTSRLLAPGDNTHQIGWLTFNKFQIGSNHGVVYVKDPLVVNETYMVVQGVPGQAPAFLLNHVESDRSKAWTASVFQYQKAESAAFIYVNPVGGGTATGYYRFNSNGVFTPSGGIRLEAGAGITTEGGKFYENNKPVVRERGHVRRTVFKKEYIVAGTWYDLTEPLRDGDTVILFFATTVGINDVGIVGEPFIIAQVPVTQSWGPYVVGDIQMRGLVGSAAWYLALNSDMTKFIHRGATGFDGWYMKRIDVIRVEA
ncbi:phage tail fiber protein [Bacillus subtilis]|nr:phage tail fiber protein [Pseudomonas sp. A29(2023)]MDL5596020.1 phage tail fiber protein [Bacillus subtilis]